MRFSLSCFHVRLILDKMSSQATVSKVIELRKFDMACVACDSTIIMIGRRGVGKSTAILDLIHYHREIPRAYVVAPTDTLDNFYSNIVPQDHISKDYSSEWVDGVMLQQKNAITNHSGSNTTEDNRAIIVLDDCIYTPCWKHDPKLAFLFMHNHRLKCMFIMSLQYPISIPPNLMANVDFLIIYREPDSLIRRRIFDTTVCKTLFCNFDVFVQVMDSLSLHESMVIKVGCVNGRIEDAVFWHRATVHERFTLGEFHTTNR